MYRDQPNEYQLSFGRKLWMFQWSFLLLITAIMAIGVSVLYSVSGGSMEPWAERQIIRYCLGLVVLFTIALIDIRHWLNCAYLFYAFALLLILAVPFIGVDGGGARRWLSIGSVSLQPAELMKYTLVLALARYYNDLPGHRVSHPRYLLLPLSMIFLPAFLVIQQPDLGTALLFIIIGGGVMFMAGLSVYYIAAAALALVIAAPRLWEVLHEYQRQRILTFLDPDRDPLGAGYHVLQSKIALGAGGLTGKGFIQGTQSQLNFLPEKHTDFIFTMFAEEMGFVGGVAVIGLYGLMIIVMTYMAIKCQSRFSKLLIAGITFTVFSYVFINIAMAMGLVPVVGVPLPLMSYGGTSMVTLMLALGFAMSAYIHRHLKLTPVHARSPDRFYRRMDRYRTR